MNARHAASGALLAVALTVSGAGIAAADARPAMDRFEVPCVPMEQRLGRLEARQDAFAARQARLEARLEAALANGQRRLVARLEAELGTLARAQVQLARLIDRLSTAFADHCDPAGGT